MEFLCILVVFPILGLAIHGLVCLSSRGKGGIVAATKRCVRCNGRYQGNLCRTCNAYWPDLPVHSAPGLVEVAGHAQRLFEKSELSPQAFRQIMSCLFEVANGHFAPHEAAPRTAARQRRECAPTKAWVSEPLAPLELTEPTHLADDAAVVVGDSPATDSPGAEPAPIAQDDAAMRRERALQNMAERQRQNASPQPAPVVAEIVPPPPARAWSETLAAFMEEGNIRWGELIGGLLIVGCSLALVITFWSDIAARPLLKFLTLNGVTAALFGIGLYTAKKWKLKATSEGVLTIASLLVPLNVLAMAAVQKGSQWRLEVIGGEIVSIVLLGSLTYLGSEFLARHARLSLTLGLLVPSVLTLVARRFSAAGEVMAADLVAALAMAAAGLAALYPRGDLHAATTSERVSVGETLRRLCIPLFAAALVAGFMAWNAGDAITAAHRLSPLVALAALPVGIVGMRIAAANLSTSERAADDVRARDNLVGLSLAIGGAVLLAVGVVLAWPSPARLLIAMGLGVVACIVVAWRRNVPIATLGAVLLGAGMWAIGWQMAAGHIEWNENAGARLFDALVRNDFGFSWLPLVGMLIAGSLLLRSENWSEHATILRRGAIGCGAWSLAQIVIHTIGQPGNLLFAAYGGMVYAGLALVVSWQTKSRWWFHIFQALSTVAFSVGSVGVIEESIWFKSLEQPWFDPGMWTVLAASWATLALAWSIAEWWSARLYARHPQGESLERTWPLAVWILDAAPPLGGVLLAASLMIVAPLSVYTAAPALVSEWSPAATTGYIAAWEVFNGLHQHVRTLAVWIALGFGAVTIVFRALASVGEGARWSEPHWRYLRIGMASVMIAAAALIFASYFEAQRIAGAMLGWIAAATILLASSAESVRSLLLRQGDRDTKTLRLHPLTIGLVAGGALPWLVSGTIASLAAMGRSPWWKAFNNDPSLMWMLVAGLIAIALAALLVMNRLESFVSDRNRPLLRGLEHLVLLFAGTIVIALTIDGMRWEPLAGPALESGLSTVSPLLLYGLPIFAIALSTSLLAAATRSAAASSFATVAIHLVLSIVFFASQQFLWTQSPPSIFGAWLCFQVMAATAIAVLWLGARWIWDRKIQLNSEVAGQVLLSQLLIATTLLPAWCAIVLRPELAAELAPLAASPLAAMTLFSATLAFGFAWWKGILPGLKRSLFIAAMVLAVLVGCLWEHFSGQGGTAFHVLLVVQCIVPAVIFVGGLVLDTQWLAIPETWARSCAPRWSRLADAPSSDPMAVWAWRRWLTNIVAMTGLVALVPIVRALWVGWDGHYWYAAGCAAMGLLTYLVGGWSRARGMHHAAALLALAAACPFVYVEKGAAFAFIDGSVAAWITSIVTSGVVALSIALGGRFAFAQMRAGDERPRVVSAARVLVWYSLAMFAFIAAVTLLSRYFSDLSDYDGWVHWFRVAAMGSLVGTLSLLWDDEARESLPLIYVGGLLLVAWGLVEAAPAIGQGVDMHLWLPLFFTAAIGAYSVLVSYLSSRRYGLRAIADSIGIPESRGGLEGHFGWLATTQTIMSALISIAALVMSLSYDGWELRGIAAKPILGQAIAMAVLARGQRQSFMQSGSLILLTLYFVALSWAPLAPLPAGLWINHVAAAGGVISIAAVVCGLGLIKLLPSANQWLDAAQRLVPWFAGLAAVLISVVWCYEAALFASGTDMQVGPLPIVVVAATLGGAVLAALAAALLPGRDPLSLTERGKQVYIYGAEVAALLLIAHLRFTMPHLFGEVWRHYWPAICIGIGFAGAALSEWFERTGRKVLSDPLRNTGILAPILPAVGYYAAPTGLDYSLVLLSTALVYGGLAMARRSFPLALLSALALNGSFWTTLHRTDTLRFQDHPQLWLVPPALCVLAAAQWSRERLTHQQLTAVRYAAALVLYASSTADIVLHGMGHDIRFPIILAALSIAGAMIGIGLKVRSFLYLGTSFLAVAVVAVIKHAAVDMHQTWILWVVGIIAGVTIIAIFGLFEKKRNEILHSIDRLKAWEA